VITVRLDELTTDQRAAVESEIIVQNVVDNREMQRAEMAREMGKIAEYRKRLKRATRPLTARQRAATWCDDSDFQRAVYD